MEKLRSVIKNLYEYLSRQKSTILVLSGIVVFVTTYMLILPALTLEKDKAAQQGGIDVPAAEEIAEDSGIPETEADPQEETPEEPATGKSGRESAGKSEKNAGLDLTFEGKDYSVAVRGTDTGLSEKARVEVKEIDRKDKETAEEYESLYKEALTAVRKEDGKDKVADFRFARFYDISLVEGSEKVDPDGTVDVTISYEEALRESLDVADPDRVRIIHFAENKLTGKTKAEVLDSKDVAITTDNDKITEAAFTADSFSVYAVVYTVDFMYDIDGKSFDHSIPGGGYTTLSKLAEALGIVENKDIGDFLGNVEKVEFSAPELASVTKADADTTVGAMKKSLELDCEYSAKLTEKDINKIDSAEVCAGDWAFISLKPFESSEKLTVTLTNGEVFTIKVTDAQLSQTVITASGDTYEVTVTYSDDAGIPEGTELEVREIEQDSEEYNNYANEAWLKMNEAYFEQNKASEDGKDAEADGKDEKAEQKDPVYLKNFLQAAFFDITFVNDGKEIEPEGAVQVNIELRDGLQASRKAESTVVHFAEDDKEISTEIIDGAESAKEKNKVTEFSFEQSSFSVDGLITSVDADGTLKDNSALPKFTSNSLRAAGTLPAPQAHKTKTDNGDGTYKITLDVNGASQTTERVTKSNVIIILDESTSMHFGQYIQITNATNGQLGPGFSIDPSLQYYYQPADGYVSSGLFDPFGTPHVTTYNLRVNNGRLYRGNQLYTGPVYVFKSRLEAEQEALAVLFHDLLSHNKPGQTTSDGVSLDDIIEIDLVGFNNGAWQEQAWTTSESALNNAISNITLRNETHWWDALDTARQIAVAKRQQQPNEDIHVIFLTDGEPMRITYTMGIPSGTEKNWNACLTSAGRYTDLLQDYLHLYNIFTYGDMQDLNPVADLNPVNPRNTTENGWAGRYPDSTDLLKLTNYAYDRNQNATNYDGEYFFDAKTIEDVRTALGKIFSDIIESVAYGLVTLTDGLTSHASATTVVNGKADGFTYEVTGNQNYTVTAETSDGATDPVVTFTIGDEVLTTSEKLEFTDPLDESKKHYYYQVTAEDGKTYKMALADVDDGEVKWDLGGLGILEDGCVYSLSFDMWPNQEAYDTLADLNNGLAEWDTSKEHEVNITRSDGTTLTYYENDDYPDIVRYPDDTYAVLTNTKQQMEYSIAQTTDGETTYLGPYPENLDMPDPMPLTDRKVQIMKKWNDSLDPEQLDDVVADAEAAGNVFTADLTLQKESDDYITGIVIKPVKDGEGHVQREWPEVDDNNDPVKHDVSAGLMVSEAKATESGLIQWIRNNENYKQVRFPDPETGTLYFILEPGRDYSFVEASSDYHFQLAENVFHPMVVDGELKDVIFNDDGSIKSISDIETVSGSDNTAVLTATNDLKGGIRVYKKVFDEAGHDITDEKNNDTFSITVTMTNSDGSPYEVSGSEGGYRINYGPNNPNKGDPYYDPDTGELINYGRESSRHDITGGSFTVDLYAGDYVQVSNVDRGVTYEVAENESDLEAGYELIGIDYYKDETHITHLPEERVIDPNTSHKVIVKNKSTLTDFSFSKAWLKVDTDLTAIDAETDLLEWTENKNITVSIKRTDPDNSNDNFALTYDIDDGAGPFLPTNSGLTDAEKARYQLKKTVSNNVTTFTMDKVLPGRNAENHAYTYYAEETAAGEGDYVTYYGSVTTDDDVTTITREVDATYAADGKIILNMESPCELPHAGGIGTTIFYALGSLLAIGCGVVLISRRRMLNKN